MPNIIFYMEEGEVIITHNIDLEKEELDPADRTALILFMSLKERCESNAVSNLGIKIPTNYH